MRELRLICSGEGEAPEVDPFAAAVEHFERSQQFLVSEQAQSMKHSDMERELMKRGLELARKQYQGWLQSRAPAEAEGTVVDAEGNERTRKRVQERELETIFGTVTVQRTGYGAQGEDSLHPLDAQLNLPAERYSLEVRRRVALEAANNSFDSAGETLARYTGAQVPKRQLEQLVQRAAVDFDDFYEIRRQRGKGVPAPEPDSLLVISADGKGVVMHQQDLRSATRKAAENKNRSKLRTRLSQGPRRYRKRMATVASVYAVAPYVRTPEQMYRTLARLQQPQELPPRPRPQHKRVWASLEREPWEVLEEAFQDAIDRDIEAEDVAWVSVVDGNEHQLDILEALAQHYGVALTIVLDIYHVLGYVWDAGHAFHTEGSQQLQDWVLERLRRLLDGGVSQVAAGMRRSATKRGLSRTKRRPVDRCADYLLKYKHYLAYDCYLAAGMPIATGIVEGACRHLVKDRMGLTGARWRLSSAEAVLRLRALRASNDFDEYWRFHEAREYERNHGCRYADDEVPTIADPKAPRLKLIE